ncbi:MAG: alcohol dehydrogenase [Candidatus Pelagibacter sp.]|nr:alcohol dehydrogenase [Candidatus Pelagibacter sp.]|tara:strand:+ start:19784 stop:20833 length:1050 start_codon:yes stop_codon:yes gene_type:complete
MKIEKNKKFKSLVLNKDRPIITAIKRIQNNTLKTLAIVNSQNKLVGTLTDGDIRRGILKGININDPVMNVVNKKPAKKVLGKKNYYGLGKNINISILPVVNKKNILKSIEPNSYFNFKNFSDNTQIIIMAGGFGKRLMPLTRKIPKPLIKVNKKTLIEIIIDNFRKYGFSEFKISTFYKSNLIRKYLDKKNLGLKIEYLKEKSPLGTAGCLGLLNYKKLKDNVLIHNGDVISDLNISNLLKFHIDSQSDITVCAKEKINPSPFGQIFFKGHKIKKILEKPNSKNFINAGIYILKKSVIKNILPKRLDITSLIETKISEGLNVNIYPIYEYWVDIGRKDILKEVLSKKNT